MDLTVTTIIGKPAPEVYGFGRDPENLPAGAWMHRNPSRNITHTRTLDEAAHGFDIVRNEQDHCGKVVGKP